MSPPRRRPSVESYGSCAARGSAASGLVHQPQQIMWCFGDGPAKTATPCLPMARKPPRRGSAARDAAEPAFDIGQSGVQVSAGGPRASGHAQTRPRIEKTTSFLIAYANQCEALSRRAGPPRAHPAGAPGVRPKKEKGLGFFPHLYPPPPPPGGSPPRLMRVMLICAMNRAISRHAPKPPTRVGTAAPRGPPVRPA